MADGGLASACWHQSRCIVVFWKQFAWVTCLAGN